jgi:predicted phosphodiesterase
MDLFAAAVEAYEKHGRNKAAAARALGIPLSTFKGRLEAGKSGRACMAAASHAVSGDKRHESRIAELEAALEVARRPRTKHKAGKAQTRQKGDFKRIIIPDTHGAHVDHQALKAVLEDIRELRPAEIVLLGDHVDCGGFLAQHHTMGYVAESGYSFEHDISEANAFLDAIQDLAPQAKIHYLEGNHERRIERWIVTQTLRHSADAKYLHDHFSVESCLSLKKRKIEHYQQGQYYGGLPIPSTIRLGKCYFAHGHRTGVHAACQHLRDFGSNIVYGHTHRADSYVLRTVESGVIAAWCPGCLCKLQPLWMHTSVTGWSHGYGLQLSRSNGEFLHVSVPIIDGRSFLVPLLR